MNRKKTAIAVVGVVGAAGAAYYFTTKMREPKTRTAYDPKRKDWSKPLAEGTRPLGHGFQGGLLPMPTEQARAYNEYRKAEEYNKSQEYHKATEYAKSQAYKASQEYAKYQAYLAYQRAHGR